MRTKKTNIKPKTKSNGMLLLALAGAGLLFAKSKKAADREPLETVLPTPRPLLSTTPIYTPIVSTVNGAMITQPTPSVAAQVNYAKVLRKGSTGVEVKALQLLLKVASDGNFGALTEKALFTRTGLFSISLFGFKDFVNKPNPVGRKIITTKYNVPVYKANAFGTELGITVPIKHIPNPETYLSELHKFSANGRYMFFYSHSDIVQPKPLYFITATNAKLQ